MRTIYEPHKLRLWFGTGMEPVVDDIGKKREKNIETNRVFEKEILSTIPAIEKTKTIDFIRDRVGKVYTEKRNRRNGTNTIYAHSSCNFARS